MRTNIFLLSCALLAILMANMPLAKAVRCDSDQAPGCTDCSLAANAASEDCVPWATTVSSGSYEATTVGRPRWGGRGGRLGGRRGRRGSRGSKPIFNFFF